MSLRFTKRILEHLRHEGYTPRRLDQIAIDLGIEDELRDEFDSAIDSLKDRREIEVSGTGLISLPSLRGVGLGGEVVGTFRKAMKGFGFVKPERSMREGDIYIPAEDVRDALSGDTVKVMLHRDPRDPSGFVGSIVEVVKRKRSVFTGTLGKRGGQWLVFPDGRELTDPVVIRDAESKNAREDLKVVVEIVAYPEQGDGGSRVLAEGVITKVLGDAGRPDVETQAVIAAYNLPGEFPEECVEQAREAAAQYEREVADYQVRGIEALPDREDLTGEFILTIDPPDAKDYDDAISLRKIDSLDGGLWELGVHIADVAHFIDPNSPLDKEARDRSNSCYLPRLVIPMLPEVLSNGICSLQEGVLRYCKSAFITYDKEGRVRSERVAQTLIKSAKRLTYLEAQALIDNDEQEARRHAKTPPRYTDELLGKLRDMNTLAKMIEKRRHRQGMISLELPDVVLKYDEQGRVVDAEREDDAYTHKLIEMFMVEANEVAARLFENLGVPLLRRVHPEPTPGDVDTLRQTAMVAGYRVPKNPTREELQGLLDATRGTDAARAVHMAVLRTLTRAEYSPALIGHFALASEAYAHFTSPIRRYADLTVHRCMAAFVQATENGRRMPRTEKDMKNLGRDLMLTDYCLPEDELVSIGKHATYREEQADSAEKELTKFLVLQLLEQHVGEAYAGVVTGCNPGGVFVQLDKFLIDGFIKSVDLPGDVTRGNERPFWRIDQRSGALVDVKSGRSFKAGDKIVVKVAAVDLAKRQMELVIDDPASRAVGKARTITPKGGGPGGGLGGGFGSGGGAGFREQRTGSQKRSQRSRDRDRRKKQHRRDN
ncbi:MAG: VacB/RNase II family 3'-5' exoribonuclease [Planctomycetota bacterium]|nr:VacB/RNase II family 3'-5' exoribonuclease [Planctomycetota bacterium]